MNRHLYRAALGIVATTLFLGCGGAPNISGHFTSTAVETRSNGSGGNLYLRRDFMTAATSSVAQFNFFADAAGTQPTVVVWLNGPYTLGGPWDAVPGAYTGEFTFAELKITPKSQSFVDLLNGSAPGTCGANWKLNTEQSLTGTAGCLTLGLDLKNKSVEYDIVKLDGDLLYYGARPADGGGLDTPARRPTALQAPLARTP